MPQFHKMREVGEMKTMFRKVSGLVVILALAAAMGCASTTIDKANKDAETAGKKTGEVMRVPHSASEGIAEGIAGEPESNPYNR